MKHSLDGLSSERDKRRVDNLSERSRISNDIIQYMIIGNLTIYIFGSMCECQMIMENRSRDLTILESGEDYFVGRLKS